MISPKILENIQLLLYKEIPSLLEKLNFEDDKTFSEPLLLAYFNSKKYNPFPKEVLEELMQGYFTEKEPLKIEHSYNKNGIAYIPNIGYFKKGQSELFESVLEIEGLEVVKNYTLYYTGICLSFTKVILPIRTLIMNRFGKIMLLL